MIANVIGAALALSQSLELSLVLKATAVVALALIGARLASRARASVRHVVLASAFAALLALPLVAITAPKLAIDVPVARATVPSLRGSSTPVAPSPVFVEPARPVPAGWDLPSRVTIARAVWITGVGLCLAPLALMLWRLRRIRRTGLPFAPMLSVEIERHVARRVEFLQHEDIAAPMTFGIFRPVIVVPYDADDWSRADLQRALVHELEHVRRSDWAIHVLGRLVCAVYWFHPLVWLAGRQLSVEAERACDDAVIANSESTDYAEQLVTLAQRLSAADLQPLLGMANRSDLSARVTALLDGTQRRGRAGAGMAAAAIGAASIVVLGVAPLTAVAKVEGNAIAAVERSGDRPQTAQPKLLPKRLKAWGRPRALDRALYEAANDGHLDEVNELLAAGANANAAIDGDGSPLIGAARSGNLAIVRRLAESGADANMPVDGDGSPLIMSAAHGHLDIVRYLLDQGADVNLIVPGDENALMCASEGGHLAVVKLLVDRGANVHERIRAEWAGDTGEWRTAISQARKNGHTAVVQFLMSVGARE